MSLSNKLKLGLAAGILIGGIIFFPACCSVLPKLINLQTVSSKEELIKKKYDVILAYKEKSTRDFLSSQDEDDLEKKVQGYKDIDELLLQLSLKSINEEREINYADASELAKHVEARQKQTFPGKYAFIDMADAKLLESRTRWTMSRSEQYVLLLNSPIKSFSSNPEKAYPEIIVSAYGAKEAYRQWVEKHIVLEQNLYDSLVNATTFLVRPIAKAFIQPKKKEIVARYRASIDKHFVEN